MNALVVTTINGLTNAVEKFIKLNRYSAIYIIGDKDGKTFSYPDDRVHFISYEQQLTLPGLLSVNMPAKHYSRKNIGYLMAIHNGATSIYETDDDNFPYIEKSLDKYEFSYPLVITEPASSFNCYSLFTKKKIWPRGFPLHEITSKQPYYFDKYPVKSSVIQGLADKDPDVDAIFRLTQAEGEFLFDCKEDIAYQLSANIYCPFNSQNTLWYQEAFTLMYLPVTVSFRFTDILRSFVAKRCLDHLGLGLGFAPATVYQERNAHDLYKDFSDEIECYKNTPLVISALEDINMPTDYNATDALLACYEKLIEEKLVIVDEINYVRNWIADLGY